MKISAVNKRVQLMHENQVSVLNALRDPTCGCRIKLSSSSQATSHLPMNEFVVGSLHCWVLCWKFDLRPCLRNPEGTLQRFLFISLINYVGWSSFWTYFVSGPWSLLLSLRMESCKAMKFTRSHCALWCYDLVIESRYYHSIFVPPMHGERIGC